MAGDSPSPRQDDIEELLRQAQLAAGLAPETTPAEVAARAAARSDESATGTKASAPPPRSATATLESPPRAAEALAAGVGDDIHYLLAQTEQAIASVNQPIDPAIASLEPFQFQDFAGAAPTGERATIELLKDVDLNLRIELGRTQMFLEDVLKLKRGSVVTLDKLAGDPVDVFANGRMVARGEVLVLNDNFCVRVTELVAGDEFD
jgi:flagellar motor switch protein FliN/FliY